MSISDKEQQKMQLSEDSFPEPIHHTCKLKDGRTLSYYTFDTKIQNDNAKPVLYLHGFPGMGLEGAICAQQVAEAGGQLFAPDRDGFGHSDPTGKEADERLTSQIDDLWELVEQQKWEAFSVIAVSGGGSFALAFLTSYLDKQQNNTNVPKLEALSFVAGICCSAGTEGLMKLNQDIYKMVQNESNFRLRFMFGISRVAMSILPASWVLKLFPTKDLPKVDQDIMLDPNFGLYMVRIQILALRQGAGAPALEAGLLFRPKQGYEDALKHHYKNKRETEFPRVAIFQGEKDVNVPKSHAVFVHEELMNGEPELMLYDDLGHASLVVHKAKDYARFVLCSSSKD